MAPKKVASKTSVVSDAYKGPIISRPSKGIIQEQDQGYVIAQSIFKQLIESLEDGIVIKKNPQYDRFWAKFSRV